MPDLSDIPGLVILFFILKLIETGLLITMTILWIRGMYRAMNACHPVSRSGEPGAAWFILIPVFGLIWQFIVVNKVSETLAREYHRRGWHSDENRPGLELGIVAGVTVCAVLVLRTFFILHQGLAFIGTIAVLITMYRHMDRLNSFRERLEKQFDPSTAFGQIPVTPAMVNYPPVYPQANYSNPYAQPNPQYVNPYLPNNNPPAQNTPYVNPYLQNNNSQPPVQDTPYVNPYLTPTNPQAPQYVNPYLQDNQQKTDYVNPYLQHENPQVPSAKVLPVSDPSKWMPPVEKKETEEENPFIKPNDPV